MTDFAIAVLAFAASVYGLSAGAKLRSRRAYRSFRQGLGEAALVRRQCLPVIAAVLVSAESVVTVLAIAAIVTTASLAGATAAAVAALGIAALLSIVLAAGVATVMHRGTRARCACFGFSSDRPMGGAHLIRNLILAAVLLAGLIGSVPGHGRPGLAAVVVAVVAGVVAGLVLVRLDDLIELFAPLPLASTSAAQTARPTSSVAGRQAHAPSASGGGSE
jgi:hypothetical protein